MESNTLKIFLLLQFFIIPKISFGQSTVLFELIDVEHAGIFFRNNVTETEEKNILTKGMPYLYAGGGVGIIDINNDMLPDIFFVGNQVKSRLYLNKGNLNFIDVTDSMKIMTGEWCTGVLIADINGDNWNDIYVLKARNNDKNTGGNLLFINHKGKYFSEESKKYKLDLNDRFLAGSFFDFDQDGDLDLFLAKYPDNSIIGNDINFDFYKKFEPGYGTDILLENLNNRYFKDISSSAGILPENGFGISVITADFNGDDLTDIYVGNDFAERDFLYINLGNRKFKESLRDYFQHTSFFTMGLDYQDVNNDFLPDLISLDMNPPSLEKYKLDFNSFDFEIYKATQTNYYYQEIRNCLQIQNIDHSYSEIGQMDKIAFTDWSWSPLVADYNLDGLKDIFITNGLKRDILNQNIYMYELDSILKSKNIGWDKVSKLEILGYIEPLKLKNYFFKNEGETHFKDISSEWVAEPVNISTGATIADIDADGDYDIITNNIDSSPFIYLNKTIEAQLNSFVGFKAKNTIKGAIKIFLYTNLSKQYQELYPTRGFQSSSEPTIIFGLKQNEEIDSIIIRINKVNYINRSIKKGQYHSIENLIKDKIQLEDPNNVYITIIDTICNFSYPNKFNDFKYQPLLLKRIFPIHPLIKQIDYNDDEISDYYIGRFYKNQPLVLLGKSDGGFSRISDNKSYQDSSTIDTDIIEIKDNDQKSFLISSIHINDSLYKGVWELQANGSALSFSNVVAKTGPVSSLAVLWYNNIPYYICFGASDLNNYPSGYKSYILAYDQDHHLNIHSQLTTHINQIIGFKNVTSSVTLPTKIIYTGNFNSIHELSFSNNGELLNKIIFNGSGFWNKISVNEDKSTLLFSNLSNNFRFNLLFEDSIGVISKDIDKNQYHDILFLVNNKEKNYPIYGYKDFLSQFPKVRRNVYDVQSYKSAPIEKVFNVTINASDIKYVNTVDNMLYQNEVFSNTINQFTTLNSIVETKNHFIIGGNDLTHRPDLGYVEAGSLIIVSKKNTADFQVLNSKFKDVYNIFKTSESNIFIIQDLNGIYKVKIHYPDL